MNQAATAVARPWDRPFWKPVRRKEGVFAFLLIIHVLAIVSQGSVVIRNQTKIAQGAESLSKYRDVEFSNYQRALEIPCVCYFAVVAMIFGASIFRESFRRILLLFVRRLTLINLGSN